MRDIDDQMNEITRRSGIVKKKKELVGKIAYNATGIAACLILAVVTVLLAPKVPTSAVSTMRSEYGSLIITSPVMGYIVIGVLAFILGILVTMLCKHIYELKRAERETEDKKYTEE